MSYSIPLSALSLNSSGQLVFGASIASGAVTSVAASVPAFLSISGSPITSSGTLAISLSGTALPIANGGTNSITALSNGKIISSVSGSIVESSISTSNVFLANGTVSATGAFSLGNNQVHNVTDPTSAQDAATKNYVDNAVNGLDWKQAAFLATTTTLPTYTYSSGVITMVATGTVSVDGSVLALGNRILVKNETSTNQPYNGIYNVTTAGAVGVACVLTRSTDYNSVADIQPGDAVYIQTGTVNATTSWVQTQTITSVGGVGQNIIFVQSSGPGTIVINGTTNQIIANTVGTTTTLSTPQSIDTTSTPSFEGLHLGIAGSVTGVLQFFNSGNGNAISLSTAGGASNYSLQLPNLQGGANTFLKNDGTGSLSFSSVVLTTDVSGTLPVANGGTGDASFTTYSVITGGTTSTGALQSVSGVGTAGQILTSNGASALPTWQTASGSGTVNSGTSGDVAYYATSTNAVSDGTFLNFSSPILTLSAATPVFTISNTLSSASSETINLTNASHSFSIIGSTAGVFELKDTTASVIFFEYITSGGVTFNTSLAMSSNKITGLAAATTSGDALSYAQSSWSLAAGSLTGALAMGSNKITGLANGTASTDAAAFGQVKYLQTILGNNHTAFTTTSATFVTSNCSATITPTSASNRVKITATFTVGVSGGTDTLQFTLARGTTDLSASGNGFGEFAAANNNYSTVSITFIDSPATTSATTYNVRVLIQGGNTAHIGNTLDTPMVLEEIV